MSMFATMHLVHGRASRGSWTLFTSMGTCAVMVYVTAVSLPVVVDTVGIADAFVGHAPLKGASGGIA